MLFPLVPHTLFINHASPKVKEINKKPKEFLKKCCETNQIFDQFDNLISFDYYNIPEFKKMKMREQQDLSILHLSIAILNFDPHQ